MNTLHDKVYETICAVCFDREYVYARFLRTFRQLTEQIYENGGVMNEGTVECTGIKSDYKAVLSWSLMKRVSYAGHNEVTVSSRIIDRFTDRLYQEDTAVFDISTGEFIEDK